METREVRPTALRQFPVAPSKGKAKRNGSSRPHRDSLSNVHSSFICNSQEVARTQMSINRWLHKQTVDHLHRDTRQWKKGAYKRWDSLQYVWISKNKHAPCKKLHHKESAHCVHLSVILENADEYSGTESRLGVAWGRGQREGGTLRWLCSLLDCGDGFTVS